MNKLKSVFPIILASVIFYLPALSGAQPPDGCEIIREKIRSLPELGGDIIVPSGVYTCNSPVVLDRSHIHLIGQGQVTLRLGNGVNTPVLIMGDANTPPQPLTDIQVSNLNIDGNRWNQRFECWGGPCDRGGFSFIRNNGITVRALTRGRIQDVKITSARSGGIVTERGCFDLVINRLASVDNEFDGFAGYETFGAKMTGLHLAGNRAAGISLDIRFHGNLFRDVQIEHNGDVGIFMRDSKFNVFDKVQILESGNHGVFLAQDHDSSTCPSGNEFQDLTVEHSRGTGFLLNDSCEGNRLTGTANFLRNRDGCIGQGTAVSVKVEGKILCQD